MELILGSGLLVANGGSIKFKNQVQLDSQQQNVVAEYFDNGDIAGIYTRFIVALWMSH